jgi:hypothetical protein
MKEPTLIRVSAVYLGSRNGGYVLGAGLSHRSLQLLLLKQTSGSRSGDRLRIHTSLSMMFWGGVSMAITKGCEAETYGDSRGGLLLLGFVLLNYVSKIRVTGAAMNHTHLLLDSPSLQQELNVKTWSLSPQPAGW